MKKRYLLAAIALTIVATVCMTGCKKDEPSSEDLTTDIQEQANEVKESADAVDLTQTELDEFTDLFDTNEYNGFLSTPFNSPADIEWEMVLYNGANIAKDHVPKSEKNAYKEATGYDIYTDLFGIEASALDKFMQDHAGVKLADVKDSLSWTYLDKYDCYYFEHGDTNYVPFTCVSGKKLGNTYVLYFENDNVAGDSYCFHPDQEITIEKTDNGYLMKSNITNWEKGNDPQQTFDIEYPGTNETARFITYQGVDGNSANMIIVLNGKQQDFLTTSIFPTYGEYDSGLEIKTVVAVGQFDFNADGVKDIVVLGECSDGQRHMALYEAQGSYSEPSLYYYYILSDASTWLEGFVSELNLPSIKAYLLGDNQTGTYSNWKDAYGQLIKIENCEGNPYFDLVYIDNDDIPELVLDNSGYWVSIYTFKNGHCVPIMYQYGYGTYGNGGYSYAPRKNKISNIYTDYNYDTDESTTMYAYYSVKDGKLETEYSGETPKEFDYDFEPLSGCYEYTQFIDILANF